MKLPGESVALVLFLIGAALALLSAPMALAQSAGDAARGQLQRAFDRTFHQPGVRLVELRVSRGQRVVARRLFEMAHRQEHASSRSLVRFLAPEYLRGHALLIVNTRESLSDTWLYQPEEGRPRRIGTAQKSDSFYGSDLSLEDLEPMRWERWQIAAEMPADEAGESCLVINAWPPPESQYGRLRIWIATRVDGVLRIDFFGRGATEPRSDPEPVKRLRADLSDAREEHGFLNLRRIAIEQLGRDARTDLTIERMAIDPQIPSSLFSAPRLEREGESLFELATRYAQEEGQ